MDRSNRQGKSPSRYKKSTEATNASDPLAKSSKAAIQTNWKDIDWTPSKAIFVTLVLGIPYFSAIIVTYTSKMMPITAILIGLGLMIVFLVLLLRWLEQAEL